MRRNAAASDIESVRMGVWTTARSVGAKLLMLIYPFSVLSRPR
jgi:hypothetical protein